MQGDAVAGLLQQIRSGMRAARFADEALQTMLATTCAACRLRLAFAYIPNLQEPRRCSLQASVLPDGPGGRLIAAAVSHGTLLASRAVETGAAVVWSDFDDQPDFSQRALLHDLGFTSGMAVPATIGSEVMAVVEFFADRDLAEDVVMRWALPSAVTHLAYAMVRSEPDRPYTSGSAFSPRG